MAFGKKHMTDIIKKLKENEESYANFISLYCLTRSIRTGNDWERIMALTPPNSVLNLVIEHLRKGSDFPHQVAFFGILHYLAGYLLSKDIHIDLDGQKIYPDIWSIILAPSGSGKSTVENFISKLFADVEIKKVEPFTTAKAYLQSLNQTPKGILIKDEFAQLLAGMDQQTYLMELKEYFLKTYDNADLVRTTGKEKIQVKEPAISIYGSTVDKTFSKYVTDEMLLDGFAQRFNYIFCEERPKKKAILSHNKNLDEIKNELINTLDKIEHLKYFLSPKAIRKYEKLFESNYEQFRGISYSFFRRTHFKTIKYALLYHILMKKTSNEIDDEDIVWADRITFTHLIDIKKMLDSYDEKEAYNIIDRAVELKDRFKEQGKAFTPRDLVLYLKGKVKNITEAKVLYSLVMDIEKSELKHDAELADIKDSNKEQEAQT